MKPTGIQRLLTNGALLLIPIFIWNIVFINLLPKAYSVNAIWNDIPDGVQITENILKFIVFVLPLFVIISLKTKLQKIGLLLYILGIFFYFLSWVMQIYFPSSIWSRSIFGFMAPAYSTIIWFVGIGFIGQRPFNKIPYFSVIYISLATFFVISHSVHSYIIYAKL